MNRSAFLAILAVLASAAGVYHALNAAPTAPLPTSTQTVAYAAGLVRLLSAAHTIELSRGVTFTQSDAHLQTTAAIVTQDDQQRFVSAKSQSPVHLNDDQNDLTGSSGSVDFTQHLATVNGNVTLVMRPGAREVDAPKGSPRKNFKDPATLTCDMMTYNYRTKAGVVPGPLTMHQSIVRAGSTVPVQRTLTADGATYDGAAQTITLTGTVRGTDSDGNTIEAKAVPGKGVVVSIKEGQESVSAPFPVHGVFSVKDENKTGTLVSPTDTQTVAYIAGFAHYLSAPHTTELSKSVILTQNEARLQTNAAIITQDDQQQAVSAKSQSPVHLNDDQNDLTGSSGSVDFTQHLATVNGNVTLVMRPGAREVDAPKGSPRKNFKDPATLTCDMMTYNYRTKAGVVPGPLTMHQSIVRAGSTVPVQRTLTADGATYDGAAQTITLTGTVRGTDSDGNTIEAKAVPGKGVVVSIKEGQESVEAAFPVHGVFPVKDENGPDVSTPPSRSSSSSKAVPSPVPPKAH